MVKIEDYGWGHETPESSNYVTPAILEIAAEARPVTVLDAGCGNGVLASALAEAGYSVVGVDGDPRGIEIARKRRPDARFEVSSFADAPPGLFDFVCSTEVVEHLYAPHELTRYCFDALKPGGLLAISTPYHGFWKNLALSVTDSWDKHHTALWHGGHIKFWSRESLSQLLKDAGFEIVGFRGAGRLPYLWKSMIIVAQRPT
jgi:2-polyprenyl-3-methyl-5-hydroxy-6-metoxy-1,4-benzoquinol methylase